MEVIRTVKVKLDVPDQRRDDLHQTADQFRYCANQTSEWAWRDSSDEYCVTNKSKAEDALYDRLRDETTLTANLVQKGIRRAIEAVKSGVEAWKRGDRTSQPHFDAWSIVYDKRSATFNRDRVSLSAVDGRVECEYVLPDDTQGTPIGDYLLNEDFEFRMSTLQYDHFEDEFYLHARMKRTTEDGEEKRSRSDTHSENPTVLGVDLNVDGHFAVTSTGAFIESADYLTHRRREFEQTRRSLQETGTRAAHLTIQQMSDREHRWIQDVLHSVANDVLREARRVDATHIAFENLTGIRDRMVNAKRFHAWAFRQLYEYVEYKGDAEGVTVDQVSPAYTSQRCSKCGCTLEENRPSKHEFCCQKCGYELNADYNASKNIARKLAKRLRSGQTSPSGGATYQLALTSGTLNLNGEFHASDRVSAEGESTDKPHPHRARSSDRAK